MSNLVLSGLATEINREHQAIEQALSSAVDHAIKAGELLTQAKASLPHGAWGVWLEENCTVSTRTANNYMRVARELPLLDDSNRQRVANLPLRDALSALATPKPENDVPVWLVDKVELIASPDEALSINKPWESLIATRRGLTVCVFHSKSHPGYMDIYGWEHDCEGIWGLDRQVRKDALPRALKRLGFGAGTGWNYSETIKPTYQPLPRHGA